MTVPGLLLAAACYVLALSARRPMICALGSDGTYECWPSPVGDPEWDGT